MRKKSSTADGFEVSNVKLTREDLDDILEIFTTSFQNITIEDDEYIYDSLEELEKQRGKRVDKLVISGSPSYSVFIINHPNRKHARVETASVETWTGGYYRLQRLLEKRRRFKLAFTAWQLVAIALLLLTPGLKAIIDRALPLRISIAYTVIVTAVSVFFGIKLYKSDFNIVSLNKRHELQDFWSRNKDKILVAAISTLFAAVITYLLTTLFQQNK